MAIYFEDNWSGFDDVGGRTYRNHDSYRSSNCVQNLVEDAFPNHSVQRIWVIKGIHQRDTNPHIRVEVNGRTQHIDLYKEDIGNNEFYWRVYRVTNW